MQRTDPDTCVHAQCTSRLGGWEPTSMYVSYMHVRMYMYWRADTARMRIRRTGSLGPYIGTRRRVVCVRACVLARVTSDKKCQAAQATWWVALVIPAARIARRGFLFLPPSTLGKVVARRPTWRLPKLGWQRHSDLYHLGSATATPIVGSTSTFPGCVHCVFIPITLLYANVCRT